MTGYDDIIGMRYPRPTKRSRMSMVDRGAQFSPFAALSGYEDAIQETGRLTQTFIDLSLDGLCMLDEKLQQLYQHQAEKPAVTVIYFVPDQKKNGGSYVTVTDRIKRIDPQEQILLLDDGSAIAFNRLYDIVCDQFS